MNKLMTALTAAAMVISVGAAYAGEQAQGKIKALDQVTKQILLEDGTLFQLSDGVPIQELKLGQEVSVSYETKDGKHMADKVTVKK